MKRSFDIAEDPSFKKMKNTVCPLPPSLKRSALEIDNIDFSSLKRMRVLDDHQAMELEPIFYRVSAWLQEQGERNSLPKTYSKLIRTISPMCKMIVQVDPSIVFYHLLFNKIIIIEQLSGGKVVYHANPEPLNKAFIGIVPQESPSIPFSEDFIHALERSTSWILNNRGLHQFKSVESLLKAMEQICRFKRELSPLSVVEVLKRKGYLSNGYLPDEVYYSLPHVIVPPAAGHYPPSYSSDMEVSC